MLWCISCAMLFMSVIQHIDIGTTNTPKRLYFLGIIIIFYAPHTHQHKAGLDTAIVYQLPKTQAQAWFLQWRNVLVCIDPGINKSMQLKPKLCDQESYIDKDSLTAMLHTLPDTCAIKFIDVIQHIGGSINTNTHTLPPLLLLAQSQIGYGNCVVL